VLRGNYAAKIDDKGRLKIPNAFRGLVEGTHGKELFVTSITGEYVRIYPMPVWLAYEEKLAAVPSTHPARLKFFDRVNYFGQTAEFDQQGRVLIHSRLRESAGMTGDVDVFGQYEGVRGRRGCQRHRGIARTGDDAGDGHRWAAAMGSVQPMNETKTVSR